MVSWGLRQIVLVFFCPRYRQNAVPSRSYVGINKIILASNIVHRRLSFAIHVGVARQLVARGEFDLFIFLISIVHVVSICIYIRTIIILMFSLALLQL